MNVITICVFKINKQLFKSPVQVNKVFRYINKVFIFIFWPRSPATPLLPRVSYPVSPDPRLLPKVSCRQSPALQLLPRVSCPSLPLCVFFLASTSNLPRLLPMVSYLIGLICTAFIPHLPVLLDARFLLTCLIPTFSFYILYLSSFTPFRTFSGSLSSQKVTGWNTTVPKHFPNSF